MCALCCIIAHAHHRIRSPSVLPIHSPSNGAWPVSPFCCHAIPTRIHCLTTQSWDITGHWAQHPSVHRTQNSYQSGDLCKSQEDTKRSKQSWTSHRSWRCRDPRRRKQRKTSEKEFRAYNDNIHVSNLGSAFATVMQKKMIRACQQVTALQGLHVDTPLSQQRLRHPLTQPRLCSYQATQPTKGSSAHHSPAQNKQTNKQM